MKMNFFLIVCACLSGMVLSSTDKDQNAFDPGGVSIDLSHVQIEEDTAFGGNLIKFGDFEDQRVDLKQDPYGNWASRFGVHVPSHNKSQKALVTKIQERITQRISSENPASGDRCAALITPLDVNQYRDDKGAPMISSRIYQHVVLPETSELAKYRLSFRSRGKLENTPGDNSLISFVSFHDQPKLGGGAKQLERTLEMRYAVHHNWRDNNQEFVVPAGTRTFGIVFALYGCGEVYIDDVKLQQVELGKGPTAKVIPFAFLDKTVCVGSGQPGVLVFSFRNENEMKISHPILYLKVPDAFELIDVRDILQVESRETDGKGNVIYAINILRMRGTIRKDSYNAYNVASVMLKTELPASEHLYLSEYWIEDGAYRSKPEQFNLKVIHQASGKKPKLFRSGAMLSRGREFANDGVKEFVDFYSGIGFNSVHGMRARPMYQAFQEAGIARYTSDALSDGYRIGKISKPEESLFRLADGSPHKKVAGIEAICPVEVYQQGTYYKEDVVSLLKAILIDDDQADCFMPNWEPSTYDFKGCFCFRCKEEFIKYSKLSPDAVEKRWPDSIIASYRDVWVKFRSWQHSMIVATLEKTIHELGRSAGKDSHFIPSIGWSYCIEKGSDGGQYDPADFFDKLPWIEIWGPYIYQKLSHPYAYYPGIHLGTYYAARDVKKFVADRTPDEKTRPKLIAFPHGYQGDDWVTEPEALSFEYLCFFLNGWEGAFAYYFPRGYDQRYWSELAKANSTIAEYEHYVFKGKPSTSATVTAVTALPSADFPVSRSFLRMLPGVGDASLLQSVSYTLDDARMIAVGNFWMKGEAFFNLKIDALNKDQKYVLTQPHGKRCFANAAGDIDLTAEELQDGMMLHVGALRWNFYVLEIYKADKDYGEVITQNAVERMLEIRFPIITHAIEKEQEMFVAQKEKTEKTFGMPDYSHIQNMNHLGVSSIVKHDGDKTVVEFKTGNMTLLLDPSVGARMKSWTKGGDELISQDEEMGLGVDAFWWPKKASWPVSTPYKVVDQSKTPTGLGIVLERVLTQEDNLYLTGVVIRKTYHIHEKGFDLYSDIINPTEYTLSFAFRWHNMPRLFEIKNGKGGQALMKDQTESKVFSRSFTRKLYRFSKTVEKDFETAFRMDHQTESITEPTAVFSAPWSQSKVTATIALPQDLYCFLFWDSGNQKASTFEPIFNKTVLSPHEKWSASIQWTVD